MKPPAFTSRAFTLIELLAAIGIVLTLAALLTTAVVPQIRRSAHQTVGMQHLRQVGAAITIYGAERGYYPPGTDGIDWRGYWSDAISPYLERDSYWGSDPSPAIDSPGKSVRTPRVDRAFIANPNVMPDMLWGGVSSPVRTAIVQRPVETILLADGVQDPLTGYVDAHMWQMPGIYDSNPNNADQLIPATENLDNGTSKMRFPYKNKAAVLFADGHTELRENGKLKKRNFVVSY